MDGFLDGFSGSGPKFIAPRNLTRFTFRSDTALATLNSGEMEWMADNPRLSHRTFHPTINFLSSYLIRQWRLRGLLWKGAFFLARQPGIFTITKTAFRN